MADRLAARPRRDLLVAAGATLLGGGAAALASSGGGHRAPARRPPGVTAAQADVLALAALFAAERREIAGYTAAARAQRGRDRRTLRLFAAHERQHAQAIATAISNLGVDPPPLTPLTQLEAALPPLDRRADAYRYLRQLEQQAVATHVRTIATLSNEDARATLMAILVTEGEHLAVMSARAGEPQLGGPLLAAERA